MTAMLINHLWQSTVFAALAGLSVLALRQHGAHVRYWVWFAASVKFLVPFSALAALGALPSLMPRENCVRCRTCRTQRRHG